MKISKELNYILYGLIIFKDRFSDSGKQTHLKNLHNFHLKHGNYVKYRSKFVGIYLKKKH